ncbi:DUF3288 family protein [Crocosphaera sp. UHCC 0190]|uniref:DUF3288 family protein n=1 Tax=Crocosphaera sp. UHCC 0190 TaxID=3110246 RepID=UPI002B212C52|nr:DUF3288 family protein [Crocosphaera sp. UHCC 0190]MEA5512001.1 DUF3288 family protein [Crocosphaera sp. UHCC 0190]
MPQDQQHPQEKADREVINRLLTEEPNHHNLAELARLRIRYRNFPGARQIHRDLELILQQWQLTEEELFETTRQLHESGKVYRRQQGDDIQDWS